MKFVDEYRDPRAAAHYRGEIERIVTRSWTIMEVCGGQTHAIVRHGLDLLLPDKITLLHGPGCPVCVTPAELIDQAIELALLENITLCSFGDMLRVPGSKKDLLSVKAEGGDVRMVYSPLDALAIARDNPTRQVIFFGVGFETTAPAIAAAILQAKHLRVENFCVLPAGVAVLPAMEALLAAPNSQIQGFLAAGHVCAVTGYADYEPLAKKYGIPIVVTGFEPLDILQGIYMTVSALEEGRATVENQYVRAVKREGNSSARQLMDEIFLSADRKWRGLGIIPSGGLDLREKYAAFDAQKKFTLTVTTEDRPSLCISGQILQGHHKPHECPAFASSCTPEHPLGPTMVSSEGACAAYYRYRRSF